MHADSCILQGEKLHGVTDLDNVEQPPHEPGDSLLCCHRDEVFAIKGIRGVLCCSAVDSKSWRPMPDAWTSETNNATLIRTLGRQIHQDQLEYHEPAKIRSPISAGNSELTMFPHKKLLTTALFA
jgi:hypothetical protein